MASDAASEVGRLRTRRRPLSTALLALRPLQWTKNLLVFAGILFAARLDDPGRWLEAWTCFAAYCAASSASYLLNDVRDRAADRLHPRKRLRPVASGELPARRALWLAVVLATAAVLLAASLGPASLGLLVCFFALQAAYTTSLKHRVFVDVLAIAGLFVVRAAAGAAAVDVPISAWLLLCTGLLALFLALGKRRGELVLVEALETPGRKSLHGYTLVALDRLIAVAAAATIAAYVLYTFSARESPLFALTIPYVLLGLARYTFLLRRRGAGEEPDHVLVKDVPVLLAVCGWAATSVVVQLVDY